MPDQNFDVINVTIAGKNLVEASAGTGKTESIAKLFARAVVEGSGIPVDKILVVTFTKAATEELKNRILLYLKVLKDPQCIDNNSKREKILDFKKELQNCGQYPANEVAEKRLKEAIDDSDRISVSTIHSFCSKIIKEFAFESGCSFDMDITDDSEAIARRTVIDFFRSRANDYPHLFEKPWFNIDDLAKIAKRRLANPLLRLQEAEREDPGNDTALFFSQFFEFIDGKVKEYRSGMGLAGFDDLISILYEILSKNDSSAKALIKAVQEKYSIVFIDEFQDTDPVQTEIFSRLFGDPDHTVFYIGDPKQSIYSFRNADIFAYLKVAKEQKDLKKYQMDVNYRSSEKAVAAVNRLFAPQGIFQIIEYESSKHNTQDRIILENGSEYGIEICDITSGSGEDLEKKEVEKIILADMISRIRRLTAPDSGCRIVKDGTERPIKYSDFAIIVRKNKEAEKIKKELGKYGIPSVLNSKESIFKTVEAKDLLILLDAAANPENKKKRMAVELTVFRAPASDENGNNRDFNNFCENWREYGLFSAFSKLIRTDHISDRLAGSDRQCLTNFSQLVELLNRYEKRNRAPVGDVAKHLHDELCPGSTGDGEDEDSRIDNDSENAVKILTLHTSKGLEFNIVFSPDVMSAENPGKDNFALYHNEEDCRQYLSLSKDDVKENVRKEDLAENMRLLYVLTTRAKFLTLLYFQKSAKSRTTPLLEKIAGPDGIKAFCEGSGGTIRCRKASDPQPAPLPGSFTLDWKEEHLGRRLHYRGITSFSGISASGMTGEETGDDSSFVTDEEVTPNDRQEEKRRQNIEPNEEVTLKFPSGRDEGTLLHSIFESIDFSASDEERDRVAGTLLNKNRQLFKNCGELDEIFDSVKANVKTVCEKPVFGGFSLSRLDRGRDTLSECEFYYKVENTDLEKLCSLIRENENLELAPMKNSVDGFILGYIDLVLKAGGKYYLVDWKSNNLGDILADYTREKLEDEMKKHNYFLQFFLYLAALDLYLSKTDPDYSYEKSFGEVVYIFLRGVSDKPESETGLYRYRPKLATVKAVQRLFANSRKDKNG